MFDRDIVGDLLIEYLVCEVDKLAAVECHRHGLLLILPHLLLELDPLPPHQGLP